jgi:hypothetical protein
VFTPRKLRRTDVTLPDQGDPRRPIALASVAARVLGCLYCVTGAWVGADTWTSKTYFHRHPGDPAPVLVGLYAAAWFVAPAVLFWACANRLRAGRLWAAVVLLVLCGLTALVAGVATAVGVEAALRRRETGGATEGVLVATLSAAIFVVAALAIVFTARSVRAFAALRPPAAWGAGGFEPVMPRVPTVTGVSTMSGAPTPAASTPRPEDAQ